ncbi:MAG TPA: glycosyltransferase family 2 protein [Rhabdochlamydiaceae bacterium]|nr:glycosyltransferase family 2 protein [Rhabdochlamydiaceae bacterium]
MKTIKAILPAILIVIAALFFIGNLISGIKFPKSKNQQVETFKKSLHAKEQKPFTIVITSFNNSEFCLKNLASVFEQRYSNYRVIYIDDASTDDTFEKVKKCIQDAHQEPRVTLIRNQENLKAIENFYRTFHSCKDDEIIVMLDGDDWLAHNQVLENLNDCYADPMVWATYGSYVEYPSYKKGEARGEIPHKVHHSEKYREFAKKKFIFSHLKTGYAGLFKKIKMEDLLKDGNFMAATYDQAFMIPVVEMAKEHVHYIKDVLYIYNRNTPLNEDKVCLGVQRECTKYIHSLSPYSPISDWANECNSLLGSDLIIFSRNRPVHLYAFLESVKKNVKGLGKLTVLCECKDAYFVKAYEEIKKSFPSFEFSFLKGDFKEQLLKTLTAFPAHYVLFAQDLCIIKEPVDLQVCAEEMQKSGAYGFFLNFENQIKHAIAFDQMHAWQFLNHEKSFNFSMAIYQKEMILDTLKSLAFSDFDSLQQPWASCLNTKKIGLFFNQNKLLDLPMKDNLDQLLTKFQEGLKIDLAPYFQAQSETAHVESEPAYVKR